MEPRAKYRANYTPPLKDYDDTIYHINIGDYKIIKNFDMSPVIIPYE